jgi:hypothetical protein
LSRAADPLSFPPAATLTPRAAQSAGLPAEKEEEGGDVEEGEDVKEATTRRMVSRWQRRRR